jgi:hypothetical protein
MESVYLAELRNGVGLMSIVRATELGMKQRAAELARAGVAAPPAAVDPAVSTAMEKIAAFVPTEVIGLYVSGLGILAPTEAGGQWLLFGICALMIPLLMYLSYLLRKQKELPPPSPLTSLILGGLALVAFAAWASALPSTPFVALLGERAHLIGGFAVLVLSILMPQIAAVLGVSPKA